MSTIIPIFISLELAMVDTFQMKLNAGVWACPFEDDFTTMKPKRPMI